MMTPTPPAAMNAAATLALTPAGLYCAAGDFYVDPWQPVSRAVITHAHGDHARRGNEHYLATDVSAGVLRSRLGDIDLQTLPYGQRLRIGAAEVSLHPAGHVLGSAQVRIEVAGHVTVVSGDYKVQPDPTCAPFEVIPADVFVTESTFGLPIYRWRDEQAVLEDINAWWRANAELGRASLLYAYAFGKAQRILAGLDPGIGPIVCHGAVESLNRAYREAGVLLPATHHAADVDKAGLRRALVLAPPSAQGSTWTRRFGEHADAFASGWMQIRGTRRRKGLDRGFVLSDHADWPGLLVTIAATGAEQIYVTHGYVDPLVRWLREAGYRAERFETPFGEEDEAAAPPAEPTATAAPEGGAEPAP
ncbi:MAG: ligase-associated DNA damage response exonuclease [Rhodocyclaceae bacterium]